MTITPLGVLPGTPRGIPEDVTVVGNYAYVLYANAGLKIFDVSDPANIILVGYCETANGLELAISGSYVYVPAIAGLQIIDASDVTRPKIVGTLPGMPRDVALSGNIAYIADLSYGLVIADVSDPATPRILSKYQFQFSGGRGIALSGDLAYVTSDSGLYVLNVSDPVNPREEGHCGGVYNGSRPALSGQFAYVAEWGAGRRFQIFDISIPSNPRSVGTFGTNGVGVAVKVRNERAYLAALSRLEILDVSVPSTPRLLASYDADATGLTLEGNSLYVTSEDRGLEILDVSDPANPVLKGRYYQTGSALNVAAFGTLSVVADTSALRLIDTADPAHPVQISSINTQALDVAVSGKYAFVAAGAAGLVVVDTAEPAQPRIVAGVPAKGTYSRISIAGKRAFLTDPTFGLSIFDISAPEQPAELGAYTNISQAHGLAVSDRYALVIDAQNPPDDRDSGISVIDVSDPTSPKLVGHYGGLYNEVAMLGNYAFASEIYGTRVLDLTNPGRPAYVTNYDHGVVSTMGDYLLLENGDVMDVSNPRQARKVGMVPGHVGRSVLSADRLLSASESYGLAIYRLDPFLNSVALQSSKLTLKWDAFGSAKLQRSTGLPASSWQDVPGSETTNRIDLPVGGTSEFFRVIRSN